MKGASHHIETLKAAVNGKWLQHDHATTIEELIIDSRTTANPENSIFIAIRGVRNNGHHFIADLHRKGFRNFIVSEPMAPLAGANLIQVEDSLVALQQLAAQHRSTFNIPVIGITGSNGKTVVKEWLYHLLRADVQITRSPRSFNSQVGVPLSVWAMKEHDELGIFEAGISQPGEMDKLAPIIQPTLGIFTNIGLAHAENFTDSRQKAEEKAQLFKHCKTVIYCLDHQEIHRVLQSSSGQTWTWSMQSQAADVYIQQSSSSEGTCLQATSKGSTHEIVIPFTDKASIENACHCWALLLLKEIDPVQVLERMRSLPAINMRLELLEGIHRTTIINDVYSSDLSSLPIALEYLVQQKQYAKRTVVLSDVEQSGLQAKDLYQSIAALLEQFSIDRLIGVGPAIQAHAELFTCVEQSFFPSTEALLNALPQLQFDQETVLLKGARSFQFEAVCKRLQLQGHETILEIDLNAAVENLNYFKTQLSPGTNIMAMVKAFSYGSGSFEIANMLEFHRVNYLAVAYADEGIELRERGISLPIMVMNPETQSYAEMIRHRLEPEIFSFDVLHGFLKMLQQQGESAVYPIHLKIDTGMHRLGFDPSELEALIKILAENPQLEVKSAFSHLSSADTPEHDDWTRSQIDTFKKAAQQLEAALGYSFLKHILNSAGILRFPEAQFDMVRLGIGLYGISPITESSPALITVATLKTNVSQVKSIPKGATVGYGRHGKAHHDMQVATIPIGYADGLSRQLSQGRGMVWIAGKKVPIIGNVCMDMTMIDVTDLTVKAGDEVIIFGQELPIEEMAKQLDTIPYEILSGVSRRVKRIYYQE